MALLEINRDPSPRDVRQFGLYWLPGFCLLVAGWAVYRWESWPAAVALVSCGIASVVLVLARPRWMRTLLIGWMLAAFPIGWVVSHLLIGAIYFLVITPMALIMRAAGRDPLSRSFDRTAETYWTPREQTTDPTSYFKQY